MTRLIEVDERRARLGRRHRLAPEHEAKGPIEVARSLTAVHGTDPGSTVLGILARSPQSTIAGIEMSLYEDRSLVRVLGMRRTIFAVEHTLAPAVWASSDRTVAVPQRRRMMNMLAESKIESPESWLDEAERRFLVYLENNPGATSTEISSDDPYLGYRLALPAPGNQAATQSMASRLLTVLSAEGRVVRGRPKGGWTSTQFTWAVTDHWRTDWSPRPTTENADIEIARLWLYGHGPATVEDFAWWTGWPKGRARAAILGAGGVEVEISSGTGYLLESDLEVVTVPDSWVALLPGLDSSTMGWKQRDFYLGPHAERLFDDVGNAGPTVWANGRIIGGWTQLDDGRVVYELFEDTGEEVERMVQGKAAELENIIQDVRLKPRARRWTRSELELRNR
jgi:hypothetical protein